MSNSTQNKAEPSDQPQQQQKPQVLEEDDEFEDFPVEGTSQSRNARLNRR
jgi:26 proteasome complex subunit DSS1